MARAYAPRPYGELRAAPKSELEKLLEEPAGEVRADIYAPRDTRTSSASRRAQRPRSRSRTLLDTGRLGSVEEAMRLFASLYPHRLTAENHALVVERLRGSGLSRQAVVELAAALHAPNIRSA